MPRSSYSKGQWFLVSAVFISGIFLTLSFTLSSFMLKDSSTVAYKNHDYFLYSINNSVNEILDNCENDWQRELDGFIFNTRKYLNEKGYILNFSEPDNCDGNFTLRIIDSDMRVS